MKIDYRNKWVFIIGASSGIGLALAELLLSKGAKVLLIARNELKLRAAVDHLKGATEDCCKFRAVDAADKESLSIVLTPLFEQGIQPYCLLNCAGRALPDYFENISHQQLEESFRINVLTAWNSIQLCLPYMKQTGGYILNTSSVSGLVGVFGYTDYSITKFGLIGFSEALRSELERYQIKVSVLCPPDTATPGFEEENIRKPAETHAISANAKLMKATDVAAECLKGMEKNHFIILPNTESKLTFWLKRFFPKLLYAIIQREVRCVQSQQR
jgi:3-dehydrosphinganine reductase